MDGVIHQVSLLGETVIVVIKKVTGIVLVPVLLLFRLIKKLFSLLMIFLVGMFAPEGMSFGEYYASVSGNIKKGIKYPRKGLSDMLSAVRSYRFTVKRVVLWLLPCFAAAAMAITLRYINNSNTALHISAGGVNIGYAASESEFLQARENAEKILSLAGKGTSASLPDMSYNIAFVGINRFSDVETLTTEIIKNADTPLTEACGVYIDGKYFCAVKNEEDAEKVFNEGLARENPEGLTISYVETITYSHGLYPDTEECIWTERKLRSKIEELNGKEEYYKTEKGDDINSIAEKTGVSAETVTSLNPWITEDTVIEAGTDILISEAGDFLTLKTVKTVIRDEIIPFETLETDSDMLYKGTMRVLSEGEKGVEQITSLVTYINGKPTASEDIYRLIVRNPSPRRIQVGSREQRGTQGSVPVQQYTIPATYLGGKMVWPVSGAYNINSDYAYRWGKLHAGLDIGMGSAPGTSLGKPVLAAADGVVTTATIQSSYGYYIVIDHGGGVQTAYGHLYADSFTVYPGQSVKKGQQIARVGSTGYSTGPHLHFEVRVNGVRVDPKVYLGLN